MNMGFLGKQDVMCELGSWNNQSFKIRGLRVKVNLQIYFFWFIEYCEFVIVFIVYYWLIMKVFY